MCAVILAPCPAAQAVEIDGEPPSAPSNLTATPEIEGVRLSWHASQDNVGVDGYLIYRDGLRIDGLSGKDTSIVDSFGAAGEHAYVVYAEDKTGNLSVPSGPANATLGPIEGPACASGSCAVSFWSSGAEASWAVPAGVGQANFSVEGAQGGGSTPATDLGGFGARVEATLGPLSVGEEAIVSVGGMGESPAEGGAGGFGGGGNGTLGAGGGGYSSVKLGSTLMLLAGGGGGSGAPGFDMSAEEPLLGGAGGEGGQYGTPGLDGTATQASGATLGGGGGGKGSDEDGAGGAGGELSGSSGCAGAAPGASGASGSSLAGGGEAPGGGAGGGGGYIGGGQGGGGASDECGSKAASGGGGGGSSFATPGLTAVFGNGVKRGHGRVSIAYSNPIAATTHNYTVRPGVQRMVLARFGVLRRASRPEGVPLTASVLVSPLHGSLNLEEDGSFTYLPNADYLGVDSFTFKLTDPWGDYATGQANLTIAAPPTALISSPGGGGSYVVGQSVPTGFSCHEGKGGTGMSSCTDSNGVETRSGGSGHLDTSTPGTHKYTVTALSNDLLTGSTSIEYTVTAKPEPQVSLEGPAPEPAKPPLGIELSHGRESLRELLRTGRLVVSAAVTREAKVVLAGKARLVSSAKREGAAKAVTVFKETSVGFGEPGEREMALTLSKRGREALRTLPEVRLAITGKATDAAREKAMRTVVFILRR